MAQKRAVEVPWPLLGLDESLGFSNQKPGTTPSCLNVRAFDPLTDRARGSSRPGLSAYNSSAIGTTPMWRCLDHVALSTSLGGSTTSIVSRTIRLLGITNESGTSTLWKITTSGGTSVGTGFNANAPVIFSAEHFGNLYFADGGTASYYSSSGDALANWESAVTGGSFPKNGSAYPTLICNWRSRMVLAGVAGDRQNYFMSRLGDALDFDYSPTYTDEGQAVAGNNAAAGYSPDIINTLIPINDDMLVFGCDHSIWIMRGDPMAGGRIDNVSQSLGMPWGQPWCKDGSGRVFFFGSQGGVYLFTADGGVQDISNPIRSRLQSVNLANTLVRMVFHEREQGIYVFFRNLASGTNETHYFYDLRTQGWWPMSFSPASAGNFDPVAVHVYDGDGVSDRALILGASINKLLKVDVGANDDNGAAIASSIYLGPIKLSGQVGMVLQELQITLGTNSDAVTYAVYRGTSAEAAFNSSAVFTGTLSAAGRNVSIRDRARGDAFYVKLSNSTLDKSWTFEKLVATLKLQGRTGQRQLI